MGYEFVCTNVVAGCERNVEGGAEEDVLAKAAAHAPASMGRTTCPKT